MTVEPKDISKALALYGIDCDVVSHSFFENSFDEEVTEAKFIVKADLSNGESLVIRLIRQENYPRSRTEEQSQFTEYLRNCGIFTPKQYKSGDGFCAVYHLDGMDLNVTLEDYIGEVCNFETSKSTMFKIGELQGKMHHISEEDNLHLNGETIYNLMGYDEFTGYDNFEWYGNHGMIDADMFKKISAAYEKRMTRIKQIWDSLPKYATQSDHAIYNLTYNGTEIGIFDYNNAGDGVLVYDMIVHGIYNAMSDYKFPNNLTEDEKLDFFKSYLDGYTSQRPLSENEKSVFDDLYAIAYGIQNLRINVSDDSLEILLKNKEQDKIDTLLQKIYQDLRNKVDWWG